MAIAWLSDRRKLRRFIVAFRKLEERLATLPRYREASDGDRGMFEGIVEASDGMERLGDAVLEHADVIAGCRVFVDADRTSLLYVQRTNMDMESYTAELSLETRAGKRLPWAQPPFKLQQALRKDVSA